MSCDNKAVVIDPAPGCAEKINRALHHKKMTMEAIWITHSHWDHIAGCSELLQGRSVPVVVHALDADNLTHPGTDGIPSWVKVEPVKAVTLVRDGDALTLGSSAWKVLHTPGHSLGSVCYYHQEKGWLFSGDTLFKGTMGNISFPTSAPALMNDSLKKLCTLPEDTIVLPGHGPATTIGAEREWMEVVIREV